LNKLGGYEYDWKEGIGEITSRKGHDLGVIAQEVEEIFPTLVTTRENGYKAVQYEKFVPILIEAIKELKAEIDELKNKK